MIGPLSSQEAQQRSATHNLVIDIVRLKYPQDQTAYRQVWGWMQAQPDLYEHLHGFDDFKQFVSPDFEVVDFALLDNGEMIGFAAWMYQGGKRCKFCLVTPPKVKLKRLLIALRLLQASYFLQLSFNELYIHLRPLPQYDRARKLAKLMGWTRVNDDLWTMTLSDYLDSLLSQETNVEKQRRNKTPLREYDGNP